MTVDCHAHWIPPPLASALRRRRRVPYIEQGARGEQFVTSQGCRPLGPLVDLEARLESMDRHGVRLQLLSLAGLFGLDCLPPTESLPLVQAFNDAAAAACRRHPGRFVALAALPLADIGLACRELERAHMLGLRGAILPADGMESLAVAQRFRPLFDAGNRLCSHFFVHPGPLEPQPQQNLREGQDNAWQRLIVLKTQARLSEAVFTLCLSDYLTPYARVSVQIANLGGSIPFLVERMASVQRGDGPLHEAGGDELRRCYVDTASFGARGIEAAVACFGRDRVLFGTDSPIFGTGPMLDAVTTARLDAETRIMVTAGNACRLLEQGPV